MIELKDIMNRVSLPQPVIARPSCAPDFYSMETMLDAVWTIGCRIDSRFVLDKDNTDVYTNLICWVMGDPRMEAVDPRSGRRIPARLDKGIYLAGNTGSGKTVAMTIVRKLYDCTINAFKDLNGKTYAWYEKRADEIADIFASTGEIEQFKRAPLLSIQDLGCEPVETLYMGNRSRVLQGIIEYRGDLRNAVTMVTSNIPLGHEDLRARYGERAVSRMSEMMNYLTLTGRDRRQNY